VTKHSPKNLAIGCSAFVAILVIVACYRRPPIDLVLEFWHLRPAEEVFDIRQIDQNNNLGTGIATQVDQLRLKSMARGGSGGISFDSGTGAAKVHILLLAEESVLNDAELAIPKSGDVVYLLRNQKWEAHPQEMTAAVEQKIQITADPTKKGAFALRITRIPQEPNGFHYAPAWDEGTRAMTSPGAR
jgi:hypothetical protein